MIFFVSVIYLCVYRIKFQTQMDEKSAIFLFGRLYARFPRRSYLTLRENFSAELLAKPEYFESCHEIQAEFFISALLRH